MRLSLAVLASLCLTALGQADDSTLKVKEGDKLPDITLKATQPEKALPELKGKDTLSLNDLKGKKNIVLFFYPRAMTSGCTVESCGFRDAAGEFAKLDTVVIGISTDKLGAQQQFTEKESLNFPLLADDEFAVTKKLGAMHPQRDGISQRVTFVIDKEGVVRKVYDSVQVKAHPKQVLKFIEEEIEK